MKQIIVLRTDLKLGKGKLVAQGAHASLQAYKQASPTARREWESTGAKKIVVKVNSKRELFQLVRRCKKLPLAIIRDAGHTQVRPGEVTALGIGPARDQDLEVLTGELKLL